MPLQVDNMTLNLNLNPSGLNLKLLIGHNTPKPADALLMNSLQKVEITTSDGNNNGFQIVFSVGRASLDDTEEYPLLKNKTIKLYNRVIIIVYFGLDSKVLMDGIITRHEFNPSIEPGKSTFTITGLDISIAMDVEQKKEEHPEQSADEIVTNIIKSEPYTEYCLEPDVKPAGKKTNKNESVPKQDETDLEYIKRLADDNAHIFYIEPTDAPGNNKAYWGPPDLKSKPQKALLFNMEEFTNVKSITFSTDGLKASTTQGQTTTEENGKTEEIPKIPKTTNYSSHRLEVINTLKKSKSLSDAYEKVQNDEIKSGLDVTKVEGELDFIAYGDVLKVRHPIELRGVGKTYGGKYYVKEVTHTITKGSYKQKFKLTRKEPEITGKED